MKEPLDYTAITDTHPAGLECWIGFGANSGNERAAFEMACARLTDCPKIEITRRSGLYRTAPVGEAAGQGFVNAVCSVVTTMSPIALLDLCQEIERDAGRVRSVRWGPRPLDLDLLFVGQTIIDSPRLTVPHPGTWYRRFVLDPLCEIAPNLQHPVIHQTMIDIRRGWEQRPITIGYDERWRSPVEAAQHRICQGFSEVTLEPISWTGGASKANVLTKLKAVVRLDPSEPKVSVWNEVPVIDLSTAPGTADRKLIDFLAAAFDQPVRIADLF